MPDRTRVLCVFTAAYFLSFFFRSANAVIAPNLARDMALSARDLGLMTSLFYAAFAGVQIPIGAALDRFGPRWVTPVLMLTAASGSLLFAGAHSFWVLSAGRALMGAGMAGVLMGGLKAVSQWYPRERFAAASGLLIGVGTLGALVATTPLAWLSAILGWRAVFLGGAAVVTISAVSVAAWARGGPPGGSSNAEVRGAAGPKASPGVAAQAAASGLAVVVADARFWRIALLNFFLTGTLLATQGLWGGPYLYDVARLPKIEAGNMLLLLGAGLALGAFVAGRLTNRFGPARVVVAAAALFAATQLVLATKPPAGLLPGLFFCFGASGAGNFMLLAHARLAFPLALTGRAVTAVNLFGISGAFLLQWWMGMIVGAFPSDAAGHYPPGAYSAAFLFTAAGTLATLALYAPLARRSD